MNIMADRPSRLLIEIKKKTWFVKSMCNIAQLALLKQPEFLSLFVCLCGIVVTNQEN